MREVGRESEGGREGHTGPKLTKCTLRKLTLTSHATIVRKNMITTIV